MEDELLLADLGVVERRLERLEKDLKKTPSAELKREQEILITCRGALENGTPLRALGLAGDALKQLRGFQFLSAKPQLLVINLDEQDLGAIDRAVELTGLTPFVGQVNTRAVPLCAKIELEIAELAARGRHGVHGGSGTEGIGPRSRDSCELRPARLHLLLHGW